MFGKQNLPQDPPLTAPIESDFSPDETDLNVFGFQKQASDVFDSLLIYSDREVLSLVGKHEIFAQNVDPSSQSLVTAVKSLTDVFLKSDTDLSTSLTERHYQELVDVLDDLIDVIGENESHTWVPLMDFISNLIESYEDDHVPELAVL